MKMKRPHFSAFFFMLLLLSTSSLSASLVKQDLTSPGDGKLTYDTATGLTWLNLTAAEDYSYSSVLAKAAPYGSMGFGFATATELAQLFVDADIKEGTSTSWDVTNINNARILMSLLGITYTDGHSYYSLAFTADSSPGVHNLGGLAVNDIGEYDVYSQGYPASPGALAIVGVGAFLVREPASITPEPSTLLLLASGLAGLLRVGKKHFG